MTLVALADEGDLPDEVEARTTSRAIVRLATEAFPGLLADLREAEQIALADSDADAAIDRSPPRVARLARAVRSASQRTDKPSTDPEEDR